MPRKYTKKEKPYKEEDINKALEEVQDCISKNLPYSERAIARKYNIQKDVFNRRLKGFSPKPAGRKMAIPLAEQKELAEKLKTMYKWGFGLFKEEIKDVVQEYVIKNNIHTPFTNNRPGEDWFSNFKDLHNLPVKKPESLEVTRQNVTSDPFIIYDFYKLCEAEITRLNLKSKPIQIYNLFEVEFPTYPSTTEVVTATGEPLHPEIQKSEKENITLLACVNSAGKALSPLIVYEANTFWSSMSKNESQGASKEMFLGVSTTGWMTSTLFHQWFTFFMKQVPERPILLLFDGNLSRLNIETIELALCNNITILKFPPHTTDLLQPLYHVVFQSLKPLWDEEVSLLQNETHKKLTKADFTRILDKVWFAGLSEQNIKSGFESTGLFPTDLTKYPKVMLDPKKLELYYLKHSSENEPTPELETSNAKTMVIQPENPTLINRQHSSKKSSSAISDIGLTSVELEHNVNDIPLFPSTSYENTSISNKSFEELLLNRTQQKETNWPNQKRLKFKAEVTI